MLGESGAGRARGAGSADGPDGRRRTPDAGVLAVAGNTGSFGPGLSAGWSLVAWYLDHAELSGIDVSGLVALDVAHSTPGGQRRALFLDEQATPEQVQALVDGFRDPSGPGVEATAELGFYQLPITLERGRGSTMIVMGTRLRVEADLCGSRRPSVTALPAVPAPFASLLGDGGWRRTLAGVVVNIPELGLVWRQRACEAACSGAPLFG